VEQLEAAWASALLKLQFIDNLVPPLPPGKASQMLLALEGPICAAKCLLHTYFGM
jgi:hypothetical protein